MSILCEALRAKVTNYLTNNFYPDASKTMVDGFCSNFQESSKRCSIMVNPSIYFIQEDLLLPSYILYILYYYIYYINFITT